MKFTKAHGTGNDFVVVADLHGEFELSPSFVRAVTDRRQGVGADGVLRIGAATSGGHVFMDYRNADGSVVEMCGNGVRVVAKHVIDHGLVQPDGEQVLVETRSGTRKVLVERDGAGRVVSATVDMGPPSFVPEEVPFDTDDADALEHEVQIDGSAVRLSVVSMGNPHAVLRIDDVDTAAVATLGSRLESHPRFPSKVNVGFVQHVDRSNVRLRVWERGVGETQACGTGACAAVAALQRAGVVDDAVEVRVPGGVLTVKRDGDTLWMTGDAVEVAHGQLDDSWLAWAQEQP